MIARIWVEPSLADGAREFIEAGAIRLEITGDQQDCLLQILSCDERRESTSTVIYSGGWISCELARSLAGHLDIALGEMGDLLDHLHVKVRDCGLGCF